MIPASQMARMGGMAGVAAMPQPVMQHVQHLPHITPTYAIQQPNGQVVLVQHIQRPSV